MEYTTVQSNLNNHFSQQTLDTQKGFCCTDTDGRKIIRWVGCKPSVFMSSQTLFSSNDLALCGWFQNVENYNYATVMLAPGETIEQSVNCQFLLVKTSWPSDSLEAGKLLEIGIGDQPAYIGQTIPFLVGSPDLNNLTYKYFTMKDLFHINCVSSITTPIKLNNISQYNCSISILHAK